MQDKQISLLIGNGFNRTIKKDIPKWDDLLKIPLEQYHLSKSFVDIPKMSYPIKFEYVVNFIQQKTGKYSRKTYGDVKSIIIKELMDKLQGNDSKLDKELTQRLKELQPKAILTTNYDTMLEGVFYHRGNSYKYPPQLIKYLGSVKSLHAGAILSKTATLGKKGAKTDFYHIHGIDGVIESICLGYEHYSKIIELLRSKLVGKESIPNIVQYLKSGTPKNLATQYETRFFDTDLYIMGLGLEEQEIDIWWLLCYRAYLYYSDIHGAKSLITNRIVYYDVHGEHITNEGYSFEKSYQEQKKALFSNLNIEYKPKIVKNSFLEEYIKVLEEIK